MRCNSFKAEGVDLASIDDELLESGELKLSDLSNEQESGYGAYVLFASLQELIISQMDP